ncbi:uncharacterized protein K02A2.6-like, partial [Temnothorax curvispinosus]|uniref:RNA-directed DNA polymerase n=1 Tax=Temnothorax curvispinosus TaxID=300111 RepID=A0A6J1QTB7_9HYME
QHGGSVVTCEPVTKKRDNQSQVHNRKAAKKGARSVRTQQNEEAVEDFIADLYRLAETCNFGTLKDELIRDQIVAGIQDQKLSEILQCDPELTLEKAVMKVRTKEEVRTQQAVLRGTEVAANLDRVSSSRGTRGKQYAKGFQRQHKKDEATTAKRCTRCGTTPQHAFSSCPARQSACNICKKTGHWAAMCRKKAVHEVSKNDSKNEAEKEDDKEDLYLGGVQAIIKKEKEGQSKTQNTEDKKQQRNIDRIRTKTAHSEPPWMAQVSINGKDVSVKVDTGADVTVISEELYRQHLVGIALTNAGKGLQVGDSIPLNVLGKLQVKIEWRNKAAIDHIYVVKENMQPLLGRPAIRALGMLDWVIDMVIAEVSNDKPESEFSNVFEGLGCLRKCKPYHICFKPDTKPYAVSVPRRVPLHLMHKVKEELERLEELGVISRVVEPTEWCAPMVAVLKANKKDVRICINYTELNKCVVRNRHIMPSVEENLAQLGEARWFSLLDANKGYHQVPLCKCCRHVTTFITPFGRYCSDRLPMGLCPSAEHFQESMSTVLDGLQNVVNLSDDVLVHGRTLEEHDKCLRAVLQRLSEAGLTLNKNKCVFRQKRVRFLGYIVSADEGVQPDPEKVKAITSMKRPTNTKEVKRFLGMVHFQLKFIEHLADITKPLRKLLKDSVEFMWESPQEKAFKEVKKRLIEAPALALFNTNKKTRISADSSSYGLGAVLEQFDEEQEDWRPVYYASRALSETEKRYAQIEKEALALTWAWKALMTADTLSRAPLSDARDAEDCLCDDGIEKFVQAVVKRRMSDQFAIKIREMQDKDMVMQEVLKYVREGWPRYRRDVPEKLLPYFEEKGILTVTPDGTFLCGTRIHIPKGLRNEVLERIHQGHLGEKKCQGRARQSVWWPGVNADVRARCLKCTICLEHRLQTKEPLIVTEPPERPWQEVAVDFCEREGRHYLVMVDYFSRYPEVVYMSSTTAANTIAKMKDIFGRHGIPEQVRSDNGPQFSSQEYKQFAENFGFAIVTSSPRYPQSNGKVEAAVKTVKRILEKETEPTLVYWHIVLLLWKQAAARLWAGKFRSKQQYDKRHRVRELPELMPGELVWIKDQQAYGTVVRRRTEPRSYDVRYPGGLLRRNRSFLESTRRTMEDDDEDEDDWGTVANEDQPRQEADKEPAPAEQPEPLRQSSRQHNTPRRLHYQQLGKPTC